MKSKFIIVVALVLSTPSWASTSGGGVYVGNGGDVIICTSPLPGVLGGDEVLMVDFWLALIGAPMNPVQPEVNRFEKLETFNKAFQFFDEKLRRVPWFYNQMKQVAETLKIDNDSYVSGPLIDALDDGFPFALPEECRKTQVALRRSQRVYLDKTLYAKMSEEQRAILYMHEYIYATGALRYGHDSSVRTQDLIVFLLQNDPDSKILGTYLTDHFTVRP